MNQTEFYKAAYEQTKAERDELLAALEILNPGPGIWVTPDSFQAKTIIAAVNKAKGL